MSFLKITDPSKRAAMVDEYLKLKKSIQQSSLSEKLGDSDLQRDLIKLYKPITESQAGIAKELSDTSTALKALPESISSTLQAIMPPPDPFSQYPSIEAFEGPIQKYGVLAQEYLDDETDRDKTFGINLKKGKFYIGPTKITIQDNDVTVGEKTYAGTPGLWELLTKKEPKNYSEDDFRNYANIMWETKAMESTQKDPKHKPKPKSSGGLKYNKIIKYIWHGTKGEADIEPETSSPAPETTGEAVAVYLPSDPNELASLLKLRMDAYNAGNTGVVDEIIAICDGLLRQGVIDKERYKEFMVYLNRL